MTPAELEQALSDLDAEELEQLSELLRDRARRLRRSSLLEAAPRGSWPSDEAIWEWVLIDMVRVGHPWWLAAEVVSDLARSIDHLNDETIDDLLANAFVHIGLSRGVDLAAA